MRKHFKLVLKGKKKENKKIVENIFLHMLRVFSFAVFDLSACDATLAKPFISSIEMLLQLSVCDTLFKDI